MTEKPEKMGHYKIYKLYTPDSDTCDKFYIGSTKNVNARKAAHKSVCYNPNSPCYNTKKYITIRENGGFDEWRMIVIKDLGICTKQHAFMEEDKIRSSLKANLNTICAFVPAEERRDKSIAQTKQWRENNPERSKELIKSWRENNPERYKEIVKVWQENNPQRKKEYNKTYYEKNKETILKKARNKRAENLTNIEKLDD